MKATEVRALKIWVAAAAITFVAVAVSEQRPLTARQANTEELCHVRGNGAFAPLSVNSKAVAAHLAHGDGRPLGLAADGSFVFSSTCELVANVAGTWLGESITFDPNGDPACTEDLNQYRLTLQQSGSDVSGEVYWKILQSSYPSDIGVEQMVTLSSGNISGNTFTFTYGPPQLGLVATATLTGTTMTGSIATVESSACDPNAFALVRQ